MPDIGQMITPPKSKSPWTAMTAGSTGGWAAGIEPWGGALTTAAGAIPGVGPALATGMGAAGMMGGGTGFQGTDRGWGNIGPTLMGAGFGYGMGGVGKGVATGISSAMAEGAGPVLNKFTSGFGKGVGEYFKPLTSMFKGGAGTPETLATGTPPGGLSKALQTPSAPTEGGGLWGGIKDFLFGGSKAAEAGKQGLLTDFLKNPSKLLGVGTMLAGYGASALATTPKAPDIGAITKKWMTPEAITDIGKKAMEAAKGMIGGGSAEWMDRWLNSEYFEATTKKIKTGYDKMRKTLSQRFEKYGMSWSGQHMEELQNIDEMEQQEVNALTYDFGSRNFQVAEQNRYNTVIASLNLDQQTKQAMLYGEIDSVMLQYGIDYQDLMSFRQMAANAGLYGQLSEMGAFDTAVA